MEQTINIPQPAPLPEIQYTIPPVRVPEVPVVSPPSVAPPSVSLPDPAHQIAQPASSETVHAQTQAQTQEKTQGEIQEKTAEPATGGTAAPSSDVAPPQGQETAARRALTESEQRIRDDLLTYVLGEINPLLQKLEHISNNAIHAQANSNLKNLEDGIRSKIEKRFAKLNFELERKGS